MLVLIFAFWADSDVSWHAYAGIWSFTVGFFLITALFKRPGFFQTALFLDSHYSLEERMSSSLYIMQNEPFASQMDCAEIDRALLEDTALCMAKVWHCPPYPRSIRAQKYQILFILSLILSGITILWHNYPVAHSQNYTISNPVQKSVVANLLETSRQLSSTKEKELANKLANKAMLWSRSDVSTGQMVKELLPLIAILRETLEQRKSSPLVRIGNSSDMIPELADMGKDRESKQGIVSPELETAKKLLSSPQKEQIINQIRDMLREKQDSFLQSLLKAIESQDQKVVAEFLRQTEEESKSIRGLQNALDTLSRIVRGLGASPSESSQMSFLENAYHNKIKEKSASQGTSTPFYRRQKEPGEKNIPPEPDKSKPDVPKPLLAVPPLPSDISYYKAYIKKPWWPVEYSDVVTNYLLKMETGSPK